MNDEYEDILRYMPVNDPAYDLDMVNITKLNFDPTSPASKINNDLESFKNKFIFGHLNARSLNKNIFELKQVLDKTHFDAFAVSETWFTKNTPRDRYMLDNYNIIRSDRKNKRGGGVCLFLGKQYTKFKVIKIPNVCDMPEMLWVEVTVGRCKLA